MSEKPTAENQAPENPPAPSESPVVPPPPEEKDSIGEFITRHILEKDTVFFEG